MDKGVCVRASQKGSALAGAGACAHLGVAMAWRRRVPGRQSGFLQCICMVLDIQT